MENTTTSTSAKTKVWSLIVLLVLAVGFWLWSISFLDARTADRKIAEQKAAKAAVPKTGMINDEQLFTDLNTAEESNTEIELRTIDGEFNQ